MPDLDVQNLGDSYPPTLSASSVTAGQSVTLTYRLSNWGPGSAPSSTTGIYRSTDGIISTGDTGIGIDSNASLAANTGIFETFTINTTGWAPGNYYIGAIADYANLIAESDETNNASSGVWLTVTAPSQLPDLDVQNAGDSYPPFLSASSVTAGQSVTLTYRLSNWGPGSAPSSTTGIYRSTDGTISTGDTRIGTDSSASLSANTGRTETFTIDTTGWAPGNYYIGAVADYSNSIAEGNESNNASSGVWLTVTAPTTDTTAPLLSNLSPADNSTGVAVGANLMLTFNEAVRAGSGNVIIYNSNGTVFRTIAVTDTSQVTFSGSTMTINPAANLAAGAGYYVQMASGVVKDTAGNNYSGITSTTGFNFTTASGAADAGNNLTTATALALGGAVSQSVGAGADIDDFFRFTATQNGRVTANLTGLSADIDLRALNSAGTELAAGVNGGTLNESIGFNVTAGQTYYLRVDPYLAASSNYSLATSFTPATTGVWTKPIALTQSPLAGVPISVNQGYGGATSHHSNHGQHSIDLQAAVGTDVLAVVSGDVVKTGGSNIASTGFFITIKGDNGLYVSYFHLSQILAFSGRVTAGDHIAESGSSGLWNGQPIPAHLHIQFGDRLSDTGNVAWSSSVTNGVPAAFLASFFSGANASETAGLVNVLNSTSIRSTDIFGTGAANLVQGTRDDDRMTGSSLGERMFGGRGHDVLNGAGGNDTLESGPINLLDRRRAA